MKTHPVQNNFTMGEISPRMVMRTDKFPYGVKTLTNMTVLPWGGVTRRPGTHFVAEVKNSAKKVRLVPFEFNTEQAYILEFGDLYIRFYKDSGRIEEPAGTPVEIATPYVEADLPTLQFAQDADTLYIVSSTGTYKTKKLTRSSHTSWQLSDVNFLDGPYLDENTASDATITPSGTTGNITLTAPANFITNGTFDTDISGWTDLSTGTGIVYWLSGVQRMNLSGESNGEAIAEQGINTVPGTTYKLKFYQPWSNRSYSVRVGSSSGGNDIVAGAVFNTGGTKEITFKAISTTSYIQFATTYDANGSTGVEIDNVVCYPVLFTSNHVGAPWRLKHGSTWGVVRITGFTSDTQVNATVLQTLGGATATSEWQEGAWSTENGYPRSVTFHGDGRLWFGGSLKQPQTLWGSRINDYETFTPGTLDDDPITITLATNKVHEIRFLSSERPLIAGTVSGEFRISASSDGPITPSNVSAHLETTYGSALVAPLRIGSSTLFVQRSGRKLYALGYSFEFDAYRGTDLAILSEHIITKWGIKEIAYAQETDKMIWMIDNGGYLLGLTYNPEHQVAGWHKHWTGSGWENVAVIPHPNGDRDQVWVVVYRYINGAWKRYIEYLDDVNGASGHGNKMTVDSALTYSGAPTSTISGLGHLEGQTVEVITSSVPQGTKVVSGGSITLDSPSGSVIVGLPFTSTLETLRFDVPTQSGSSLGRPRSWGNITVRLYESIGCTINGEQIETRLPEDLQDYSVPLFSGDVPVLNLGWDSEATVKIEQTQPLPLTVLGITGTLDLADD